MEYSQEDLFLACEKFEKCTYRTKKPKIKKSCCSVRQIEAFACIKKKIFPLSPTKHCLKCKNFNK